MNYSTQNFICKVLKNDNLVGCERIAMPVSVSEKPLFHPAKSLKKINKNSLVQNILYFDKILSFFLE